ncbi:unnamed protein product, partial [Symbiodinium necroappetens]
MSRSAPGNSPSNEDSLGDSDDGFVPSSNSEPGMEADNGNAAGEDGDTSPPAGPPLEMEQGPRLPHAGFHRPIYQLPYDYPQLLERMACTALRELCFFYLAQHLHIRYPDRRSSQARYLAQRRARGHQDPGDVYSYIFVQLEEPRAQQLDEDYRALAGILDQGIPENDLGWITRIGGSKDPPRHVFLQHLAMLLRRSLRRHLQPSSADHVSAHMVEVAREMDLFYIPTLLSLYPLLDDTGKRDFQQWFYGYTGQDLMQDERWETSPIREPASSSRGTSGPADCERPELYVDLADAGFAGILILIDKTLYTSVQERVAQRDQLLSKRAEFLAKLATLLHSLPKRNQLLVLGDLNTDLSPEGSHVGVHVSPCWADRPQVLPFVPATGPLDLTPEANLFENSGDLGYLSRHLSALHPEAYRLHDAVLQPDIAADLGMLRPSSMESNQDVIRESAAEVASQELMSAREQAALLSSMMNKNPSTPPSSTNAVNPSEASTGPNTPVPETRAPREVPVPMETRETKRQADLTEQELQDTSGGNGNGKGGDKWPRSQSKGNSRASDGGWGRDHRAPQRRYRQWDWDKDKDKEDKTFDRATDRKLYELCLAMSRLIMRHEDQLSINRAQDNFVMFAQTQGVLSAVPELLKATEAWRQMKKEQPEIITLPLRT